MQQHRIADRASLAESGQNKQEVSTKQGNAPIGYNGKSATKLWAPIKASTFEDMESGENKYCKLLESEEGRKHGIRKIVVYQHTLQACADAVSTDLDCSEIFYSNFKHFTAKEEGGIPTSGLPPRCRCVTRDAKEQAVRAKQPPCAMEPSLAKNSIYHVTSAANTGWHTGMKGLQLAANRIREIAGGFSVKTLLDEKNELQRKGEGIADQAELYAGDLSGMPKAANAFRNKLYHYHLSAQEDMKHSMEDAKLENLQEQLMAYYVEKGDGARTKPITGELNLRKLREKAVKELDGVDFNYRADRSEHVDDRNARLKAAKEARLAEAKKARDEIEAEKEKMVVDEIPVYREQLRWLVALGYDEMMAAMALYVFNGDKHEAEKFLALHRAEAVENIHDTVKNSTGDEKVHQYFTTLVGAAAFRPAAPSDVDEDGPKGHIERPGYEYRNHGEDSADKGAGYYRLHPEETEEDLPPSKQTALDHLMKGITNDAEAEIHDEVTPDYDSIISGDHVDTLSDPEVTPSHDNWFSGGDRVL
jgi:hypothetical protein